MGIWIDDFVEEKYNAFIIGASLKEKFFCLQYSFEGKKDSLVDKTGGHGYNHKQF